MNSSLRLINRYYIGGHMKHTLILLALMAAGIGFAGCAAEQYTQTSRHHAMKADTLRTMKIDDVIALSKAGVSDSLIIGMMDATDTGSS